MATPCRLKLCFHQLSFSNLGKMLPDLHGLSASLSLKTMWRGARMVRGRITSRMAIVAYCPGPRWKSSTKVLAEISFFALARLKWFVALVTLAGSSTGATGRSEWPSCKCQTRSLGRTRTGLMQPVSCQDFPDSLPGPSKFNSSALSPSYSK